MLPLPLPLLLVLLIHVYPCHPCYHSCHHLVLLQEVSGRGILYVSKFKGAFVLEAWRKAEQLVSRKAWMNIRHSKNYMYLPYSSEPKDIIEEHSWGVRHCCKRIQSPTHNTSVYIVVKFPPSNLSRSPSLGVEYSVVWPIPDTVLSR